LGCADGNDLAAVSRTIKVIERAAYGFGRSRPATWRLA
jgi:hypothetical protein